MADGRVARVHPSHDSSTVSADGVDTPPHDGLTEIERATLQVEAQRWKYAGAKEQHIRAVFGESPTRYYQRLNVLMDTVAAEAAYPSLVRRLRRLRDQRRAARVPAGRGVQANWS